MAHELLVEPANKGGNQPHFIWLKSPPNQKRLTGPARLDERAIVARDKPGHAKAGLLGMVMDRLKPTQRRFAPSRGFEHQILSKPLRAKGPIAMPPEQRLQRGSDLPKMYWRARHIHARIIRWRAVKEKRPRSPDGRWPRSLGKGMDATGVFNPAPPC